MPIRKLALPAALVVAVGTALAASPVYAHAFGERYDLPLPLNLFMIAAAAAVAASFRHHRPLRQQAARRVPVSHTQPARSPRAWRGPVKQGIHLRVQAPRRRRVPAPDCHQPLRRQQARRELLAHLRLDHLVGRHGLHLRPARQPLDARQPVEDHVRVGRGLPHE